MTASTKDNLLVGASIVGAICGLILSVSVTVCLALMIVEFAQQRPMLLSALFVGFIGLSMSLCLGVLTILWNDTTGTCFLPVSNYDQWKTASPDDVFAHRDEDEDEDDFDDSDLEDDFDDDDEYWDDDDYDTDLEDDDYDDDGDW